MHSNGRINISLPQPSNPPSAVQTIGITRFEPGVDELFDDGSEVGTSRYGYLPGGEGDKEKYHGTPYDDGSDAVPIRVGQPPVSTATAHWVNHNTPLLHEYATRQVSPPLLNRINVEFNHPSQFVTGVMQMLANRDNGGEEDPEPSRRTPPELLEGFVDLDRWAKEYLRTQFGLERFGDGVPNLLTIIANNFYEAHMHLMDAIMEKALLNMDTRRGPFLEVADFNFGFDLHIAQEMPFLVNARHRVRETLDHLHSASKSPAVLPDGKFSHYGRKLKPTAKATGSRGPPPVQPKQIMPKVPKSTRPSALISPSGTNDTKTPSADGSIKKGQARKSQSGIKPLADTDDPSVTVSNKNRQPLSETFLLNTSPPESEAMGGKTAKHLALIKRCASVPASASNWNTRPSDQSPLKIIIKPLARFASKVSTDGSSAPGSTLAADTVSVDTIVSSCDPKGDLVNCDTKTPQNTSGAGTVTQPSKPSFEMGASSLGFSSQTTVGRLKRKRENSVENRLS